MDIKIVLCFIMLFFLPAASASTDVWVAKHSGFIKSDQSLSFENYLVKSKTLDNTKAAITVYKNQNEIETRDFYVNDFKKYDAIGITLLGIKGDFSWISISKLENKDVWRAFAKKKLIWGETYAVENYTLNIDTFGTDSVNLIVSNKSLSETDIFSVDGFKDYRDLRIAVRDINRTGFIELEFFTNRAPAIKAEVLTDKNEYFPDETIYVTINTMSDVAQNIVGITMESTPTEIRPTSFSAAGVIGTQSFPSLITNAPANSTVIIRAKIETRDYYNNAYFTTVSKDIVITPEVPVIKRVLSEDADDENVTVQVYVYNSGTGTKSIHVHDTIPEELAARELDWNIELGSKKSTTFEYNVTPQKPGLYFLPPAKAQWEGRSSSSKRVRMTMHMPYISMTKTSETNRSLTDVKLVISNTGDRPAQVKVSDKIPQGYSIAGGDAVWSGKLEGGGSATTMYSLQGNIETLPAAEATYRDIRGVVRHAQSNLIEDKAEGNNILNAEPYKIMSFMLSSFALIGGIITGATLVAYLLVKRRK